MSALHQAVAGARLVAALYVDPKGVYSGLPDVEVWDEARDARKYAGPWPVVAHPPCARWCLMAALVEATHGYKRGDDGGCFDAALTAVRRFGGVLEHPAFSDAWRVFGLPRPTLGGWQRGLCGGWSAHVLQWHYGHRALKETWLYAFGVELPRLVQASIPSDAAPAYVTDGGGDIKRLRPRSKALRPDRNRLGSREASATPIAFRDLLLSMARSLVPVSAEMGPEMARVEGSE